MRDGRLALLPIVTADVPVPTQRYLTLQAGLASGQVTAFDGGHIFSITITNRSELPLAILGGELVVGGQQDRLAVADTVIAPHRSMAIATLCAELGRMEGGSYFRASHVLAEPTLRRLARAEDQAGVWSRIDVLNGTSSQSYRHAARQQRTGVNADRLRHLVGELDKVDRREERSKVVGFAVAVDDKVVAIEHFASPALYRDVRAMVIASYLPLTVGKPHAEPTVGPRDVRAFRERTGEGAPRPRRSPPAAPSGARPDLL